jgi:hypothetical protein
LGDWEQLQFNLAVFTFGNGIEDALNKSAARGKGKNKENPEALLRRLLSDDTQQGFAPLGYKKNVPVVKLEKGQSVLDAFGIKTPTNKVM